jgi:hypothetical protein
MRKLITILLVAISATSFAQATRTEAFQNATAAGVVKTRDTTTNTDTSYLWTSRSDFSNWDNVALQFACTQITGTTTCTIIVQGSNDATTPVNGTWVTLKNSTTQTVGLSDTGTVKNTTYTFQLPSCQYKRLRVRVITGGTQTSILTGTYFCAAAYKKDL